MKTFKITLVMMSLWGAATQAQEIAMLPNDHRSLTCMIAVQDATPTALERVQKLVSEFADEALRLGRDDESYSIQFTSVFTQGQSTEKRTRKLLSRLESLGRNVPGVSLLGCAEGPKTVTAQVISSI